MFVAIRRQRNTYLYCRNFLKIRYSKPCQSNNHQALNTNSLNDKAVLIAHNTNYILHNTISAFPLPTIGLATA